MGLMETTRRKFFAIAGASPLAAKEAADKLMADAIDARISGLGGASLGLAYGCSPPDHPTVRDGPFIPYEQRAIKANEYIKLFGVPEVVEFEMRDRAKNVQFLDHDIACKKSWSMSVKIMTQRQRNYERNIEMMKRSAWRQHSINKITKFLGFEWPW